MEEDTELEEGEAKEPCDPDKDFSYLVCFATYLVFFIFRILLSYSPFCLYFLLFPDQFVRFSTPEFFWANWGSLVPFSPPSLDEKVLSGFLRAVALWLVYPRDLGVYVLESLPRSSWNVLGRGAGRDGRMRWSMYRWSPWPSLILLFELFSVTIVLLLLMTSLWEICFLFESKWQFFKLYVCCINPSTSALSYIKRVF